MSLLEFTFPLLCPPGPDQTNLPKVVHGKYVTDTADQKYDFKTATSLSASANLFSSSQSPASSVRRQIFNQMKSNSLGWDEYPSRLGHGVWDCIFSDYIFEGEQCKISLYKFNFATAIKCSQYMIDGLFLRSLTKCQEANAICSAI